MSYVPILVAIFESELPENPLLIQGEICVNGNIVG